MKAFRLRTKLLLTLVAISTGLMATSLLAVRYSVQNQVRAAISDDLRNSVNTYLLFEQQGDTTLTRSAELLANIPNIRGIVATHDASKIQPASAELWRMSGCDLLALADSHGSILALDTLSKSFSEKHAQNAIAHTLQRHSQHDWWFGANLLYEVWLEPVHATTKDEPDPLGFIVVGHHINDQTAHNVRNVADSEVLFSYGGIPVAGTLDGLSTEQFHSGPQPVIDVHSPTVPPREVQLEGETFLAITSRISTASSSGPQVTLSVLKSFDKASAFLGQLNRILVGLGMIMLVAGSGLVFLISDTFTRPLSNLVAGVRALENGDFSYPLSPRGGDEVAEVTAAFSTMRNALKRTYDEQKALENRLRQAHKMEAVGRLAGGVAHDYNNLLTIIRGNTDLLLAAPTLSDADRHSIDMIRGAANRAVSMTRQLLAFSRMQVLQPRVLDLNTVISKMGEKLPGLVGPSIEYTFAPENRQVRVKADAGQIEQVLTNLAVNARDAMPDGGKLTIATREMLVDENFAADHPPMPPGKYVLLSVADTGEGMDSEIQLHIFEPFFTTKESNKGTGLGLATVYGVVKQSGGFIFVDSTRGKGARFDIYLPHSTQGVAIVDSKSSPSRVSRNTGTVLVVEDEDGVRELACQFLKIKGYSVLEARNGDEALRLVQQHHQPIHVVLTDMLMPNMGGLELAEHLKNLAPDAKVIIMSDYYEYSSSTAPEIEPAFLVLQKPFSPNSLVEKVREALTGRTAARPEESLVY